MTMSMIVALLAALGVLLLVLLIVVAVAQSLKKASTAPAPAADPPQSKNPNLRMKLPKAAAQRTAGAKQTEKDSDKSKEEKKTKNAAAVFAAIASVGAAIGVVAAASDIFEGDIDPVISEITAGPLHGTMVNARNKDPVVLIVPGSGPTDRDGNNPLGVNSDAYKMLADDLIEERIATVRIDKRGMFGSAEAGDPNAVSPDIYAADIHAWIDAIKEARGEGSGCVFLLGHSEGALMVSRAAAGRDDVCGLILVAGMGRPMGQVIRDQLKANPANAPLLDQAFSALDELEAGRHVDVSNMHPALVPLFAPPVQDYLISVLRMDPVEELRAADKETLIIQGDRDLQVTVADARMLDKVRKTELRIIGGMNHVLKAAPEDAAGNLATYGDPSLPLAKDVIRRIRRFVKDND